MLGRDTARGASAVAELRGAAGRAEVTFQQVDLGSLASINAFGENWRARGEPVHFLMNVAGVMAIPQRRTTTDGFEMHMGTNFLGHFALTGLLLPALHAGNARVVTVSAAVGRWTMARLDPADLQAEQQRYTPMGAYARSKLAEIMFAAELQRRAASTGISSVAVDPGTAVTNLQRHVKGAAGSISRALATMIGYPIERVAENALYAAIMPNPTDTTLIGPSHFIQRCASPKDVGIPPLAREAGVRDALWRRAEAVTGVTFGLTGGGQA
ncbi:putative oxidoreductase/Short-chain dehydrogenase [Chondromyces apiculatus DSM 436]|uniref:Putative oxidoreductase/Short-chain dehydrogenase n=1 Tax=Chondromyces apiculatus DSM 436 TaxID=1192034 RepID=A0A017T4I3_9BACT|nr:putative oxidoreductase/Short-chain dehydrogenase [Chondromyces apiculatus DSM 436]